MDETLKEPIPQTIVDQAAKEPLRLDTDGGRTESDDSLTLVHRRGGVSSDEDSGSPRQREGWRKEAAIQETGRQISEGCPSQYIHDTNRRGRVVGGCPSVRQSGRRATIGIVSTAQFQSNTPAPSVTSTWLSYQRAIDNIAKYPQVQAHMTQRVHVTSGVKRMVRVMPNPRYIRPQGLYPLP